jgi:hypothetical protein
MNSVRVWGQKPTQVIDINGEQDANNRVSDLFNLFETGPEWDKDSGTENDIKEETGMVASWTDGEWVMVDEIPSTPQAPITCNGSQS